MMGVKQWAIGVGVALLLPAHAWAQSAPSVTTDTAEYCFDLSRRAEAKVNKPESARMLIAAGIRLCEHGHIEAGIARLRRAMKAMHQREMDQSPH